MSNYIRYFRLGKSDVLIILLIFIGYLPFAVFGTKYSRMDQVKFLKDSLQKIWKDMVCLNRFSSTNFTLSILEYFVSFVIFIVHLTNICSITAFTKVTEFFCLLSTLNKKTEIFVSCHSLTNILTFKWGQFSRTFKLCKTLDLKTIDGCCDLFSYHFMSHWGQLASCDRYQRFHCKFSLSGSIFISPYTICSKYCVNRLHAQHFL